MNHPHTTYTAARKAAADALVAYELDPTAETLAAYDVAVRALNVARKAAWTAS